MNYPQPSFIDRHPYYFARFAEWLKKKGYPQEGHDYYWCFDQPEWVGGYYHMVSLVNARPGSPAVPTLGRIIRWCLTRLI